MKKAFFLLALSLPLALLSQNDSLWVKNGNVLSGEIKTLNSGVLTMETPYSDKDFTIDFDDVERLSMQRLCIVMLTGGSRIVGYLRSEKPGEVTVRMEGGSELKYRLVEVTGLQEVRSRFWNRLKGNVDLGFNLTKANNNRQLTGSAGLHYKGVKWISDLDGSFLYSQRDDVDQVERNNVNLSTTRLLSEKWYLLASASFLSNTEQQLNGRLGLRVGPGRYLALNNKLLWGVTAGLNYNIENFVGDELDKESAEVFLSTTFNMYNFSDFSLNTRLDLYPSISERGRIRVDYTLDLKYDLPWDFYIKGGLQFNYDNQAVDAASNFDYIVTSGFGWKFN